MSSLQINMSSGDDEAKTITLAGESPVTAFVVNEFWQSVSVTNGEQAMPSDLDS